jgi:hypothetical protein
MKQINAGDSILAAIGQWDRLGFTYNKAGPGPLTLVTLCMSDISIGHVEPEGVKARPGLLHEIEKSSGAAANVEQPQSALITFGEQFVELRQRLPPHRIGRSVEQHFNLGVISLGGIIRQ